MIVVCWKWVATDGDERWAGVSDADRAALEIGLQLAETAGDAVTVVTVGEPGAEHGLRTAVAAGAVRAVRVDAPRGLASDAVAGAIAALAIDATWVLCGDASADRGTGAVPAFLAAELGAAQALGLVAVEPAGTGPLRATRRLDGGRREVLDVASPAVLSVEGAVARLRRASLPAELAARGPPRSSDGPARTGRSSTTRSVTRTARAPGRWPCRPATPWTVCGCSRTRPGSPRRTATW